MGSAPDGRRYHAGALSREDRPLVWGHRGASAHAPENTVAALDLARKVGADGVECDLLRCGSGELVLCHDDRLDRLCGVSRRVGETSLPALRELPILRARFPGQHATTPTLEEAVEACGPTLLWNVELKVESADEAERLAKEAAVVLRRLPLRGRLLVSSFHPHALLTLRKAAPELPTALLWEGRHRPLWHSLVGALTATHALHPEARWVDERWVARWHALGKLVNVWTEDEPEAQLRLAAAGVDGIITNRPEEALATLARCVRPRS